MSLHLGDPGLWSEVRTGSLTGPTLFLDRDGVIVEEVNYLHRVEDVRLTQGAAKLIATINGRNIPVIVVTNQAGVGRGYYDWAAFRAVHDEIDRLLALEGAHLDAIFACGYHEKAKPPLDAAEHPWRKPGPGMLLAAAALSSIDLSGSWIVGDRASDLAAGRTAGLAGGALVGTGYGSGADEIADAERLNGPAFRTRRIRCLADFDPDWLSAGF